MHRWIIALLTLILSAEAYACSCIGQGTVEQAFRSSDAIFAGVVVKIDDPRLRLTEKQQVVPRTVTSHLDPDDGRTITFRVLQWWKTEAFAETVELRTGYGGGDCGYPVEEGKSYLVYARRDLRNQLVFGICDRTAALLCASSDVAELGEPIKTYEKFDVPSLIEREQPYTTYWRPCIKPSLLIGERGLEMDNHCRFKVNGVIGVDGALHEFQILDRSLSQRCVASLDDHVRERVVHWRFLPAQFEGKPIETLLTTVSMREPINESDHARFLKERAEWEAKRKPK